MEQAFNLYKVSRNLTKTDRASEFDVFAGVTSKLRAAMQDPQRFGSIAEAVDQNRRLWATVAMSVADPQNSFPSALKAQLFYLFEFTDKQSRDILKGTEGLATLIDINIAVMRGLKPLVQK